MYYAAIAQIRPLHTNGLLRLQAKACFLLIVFVLPATISKPKGMQERSKGSTSFFSHFVRLFFDHLRWHTIPRRPKKYRPSPRGLSPVVPLAVFCRRSGGFFLFAGGAGEGPPLVKITRSFYHDHISRHQSKIDVNSAQGSRVKRCINPGCMLLSPVKVYPLSNYMRFQPFHFYRTLVPHIICRRVLIF